MSLSGFKIRNKNWNKNLLIYAEKIYKRRDDA